MDHDSDNRVNDYPSLYVELCNAIPNHPKTDVCPDPECMVCSMRDCPHRDPLHYHHDGCTTCEVKRNN